MIIVAGHLRTDPSHREPYLEHCQKVVALARATPGCLDFALSPDPTDPGRVNILERWESVADVEAFRNADPAGPGPTAPITARVEQYEIASVQRL